MHNRGQGSLQSYNNDNSNNNNNYTNFNNNYINFNNNHNSETNNAATATNLASMSSETNKPNNVHNSTTTLLCGGATNYSETPVPFAQANYSENNHQTNSKTNN